MLLTVDPITLELTTVTPLVDSVSNLLISYILADVSASVLPCEYAFAMHFIIEPMSAIGAAVVPGVNALSLNIILLILAFINGPIC